MALRSALVDRARTVTREGTGKKIDGTTVRKPVTGQWFKCRLAQEGPSREDVEAGRLRVDRSHTLLYWNLDIDGEPVVLNADDEIEVESNQEFGNTRWQLTAQPLIIRKKKRLLGASYVNVQRIQEP